jgi:PQQ-like domain
LAWTFPTGDAVSASPTVVEGVVYVGSWDGYFYALDAKLGTLKWKFKVDCQYTVLPIPPHCLPPGFPPPPRTTTGGGMITSSAAVAPVPLMSKEVKILNVSYDPTRELYSGINSLFAKRYKSRTGLDVSFEQSHGGSSKQGAFGDRCGRSESGSKRSPATCGAIIFSVPDRGFSPPAFIALRVSSARPWP